MKTRQAAKALAVALVALVAAAPAAGAHVTVNPREATQGGYTKLDVRVPNERDEAGTTSVEVNMPEETPIRSVSVEPVPGWDYEIEMRELDEPIEGSHGGEPITEVVGKITWSGGVINPGEFQEFPVSVGPLPEDVESLAFPAIQTYEGGEVVRWIEVPEEGAEEPEYPAPMLTLVPPEEEGAAAEPAEEAAAPAESSDDGGSNGLAIAALVVGIAGLAVGGVALARGRSTSVEAASKD